MAEADKKKLGKAGFATPRGGDKGAYQNHVTRDNQVIIPFEHLAGSNVPHFQDGYVIRLYPEQYFEGEKVPKAIFASGSVRVGENAFVLYRTYDQWERFPPMDHWEARHLVRGGARVTQRGGGATDAGHYVKRIAAHGNRTEISEGPPQGIFAPEYCDAETNYLSKCMLAWLITRTIDSPYVSTQAEWLEAILSAEGIFNTDIFERKGLTRNGLTNCPLCLRNVKYRELHATVAFSEEDALLNAGIQVINATRSTIVNLFHMSPLTYSDVCHHAENAAWGHAICNTKLGQRRCYSVAELADLGIKAAILRDGNYETFAWANETLEMLRSPQGAVWIRITTDHLSADE
ncbi:BstXI family restriction endonuclease [Roseomonas mucosa]|uniref:BstXI family restriction endonuclease n=1 Tax=Roseomonas mucosa TaxID=207340 RepID=UPI0022402045|nr:BstXI family restriction endonuclease [Roseomonas mucosa]